MNFLFILAPLAALIFLNLPFQKLMKRMAFWCASILLVMQMAIVLFPLCGILNCSLSGPASFFRFDLSADGISRVVLFTIGMILFTALLSGRYIIKSQDKLFNFTNLLLILQMGLNGVALVEDIFSLYVFIEVVAVASYIFISIEKGKLALEAAFKYIVMSAVASALMLSSIALFLLVSGSTSFSAIKSALESSPNSLFVSFATGIFICALFVKGGLVPFHGWLPDVYSAAPAPVSVFLAGIVTKVVGIYTLIRLAVSVISPGHALQQVFLIIGAFSIIVGALAALGQQDFKRMLAYSSISQVGYIIIGVGCANTLGIFGAVFHFFNHAVFKSTLFLNSAALETQVQTRDMDKMGGLGAKMPVTGITSVISSLSAAGIPPLAGFWSKLIIVIGLWISGHYFFAAIAVVASVITLAYLLSMQRAVFFGKLKAELTDIKEAGFGLVLPVLILTAITVGLGLAFPFLSFLPKF